MFRASLALLLVVIAFLPLSCAEMQSSGETNALTKLVTEENPLFIRFDELTAGFEGLRTNGAAIALTEVFRP